MSSTINLRRKIKSVKNTKQITRAMQMVAASKMRRAQEAVTGTRAYALAGREIMARLQRALRSEDQQFQLPLLTQRPVDSIALIVISSDKGLAGAYNVNVIKKAVEFLQAHKDKKVDLIIIGKKAQEGLARFGYAAVASFVDFPSRPNSTDLRAVAKLSIDEYIADKYDQVVVVYTKFYSTLKQSAEVQQILPVIQHDVIDSENEQGNMSSYLFEPDPVRVLQHIVPRLIEMQLLQTVLESIASEHSSRMLAMKNATDNASDLMSDLTLTYNSVRQANITQEIAEISAGSNN
jgi:F-type H+-transporting ATPase subunit gamma